MIYFTRFDFDAESGSGAWGYLTEKESPTGEFIRAEQIESLLTDEAEQDRKRGAALREWFYTEPSKRQPWETFITLMEWEEV